MENTNIIREIEKNNKVNYLFNNQTKNDLLELSDYIKTKKFSQIIVSFNMEEWLKVSKLIRQTNYEESLSRCNHYVALKMMKKIQYKNKRLRDLNVDGMLEIFEKNNEEKYQELKDNLFTIENLSKFIELEKIKIDRINFAIVDVPSVILSDTLSECLNKELPYNTSIYVYPGNFLTDILPNTKTPKHISEEYKYTLYNGSSLEKEYNPYSFQKQKKK